MASDILSAIVAPVPFGSFKIEGLLLDTGEFAIVLQQAANLFSVIPTSAPKWLKTNLGEGLQLFRVKTNRPKQVGKQNKAETALSLKDFEHLLAKLDRKGNKKAQEFRDDLVGTSLHQEFSRAFGRKFDEEEFQAHLKARQQSKIARRGLTDTIKEWYERNPGGTRRPKHVMYAQTTNLIYKALWSVDALQLEEILGCGRNESREYLSDSDLRLIERAESNVMDYIDEDDIKPVDAVPLANIRKAKALPRRRSSDNVNDAA